jgi:lipoate-protein ligase B
MNQKLELLLPGRLAYERALALQQHLVAEVRRTPPSRSFLILLEHPRVITIGRSGSESNLRISKDELARRGFEVFEASRGGDVTYHGPGQIVGYPILDLALHGKDIHDYMRRLEETLLSTLARWGIMGRRWEGRTGVWIDKCKIASIGVAVTRWVAYHGFALNVNVDLDDFRVINPCGFTDVQMVSMASFLSKPVEVFEVKQAVVESFCEVFGFKSYRAVSPADVGFKMAD